jgi:hypothetical protein
LTLLVICTAITTAAGVVFFTVLVTNLSSRFATSILYVSHALAVIIPSVSVAFRRESIPILTTLFKSGVQIGSNDSLIQLGASNVFQAVQGILVGVVFDKAESAGGLVEPVEAHD